MRIVVTEYPKSGGSWLVSMLGTLLNLPCRDIYIGDGYDRFDVTTHPWYRGTPSFGLTEDCVIKSHELPESPWLNFPARMLHLVRDGRDVAVSKYFFERDFCVNNGIYDRFDIPFDEYVPKIAREWRHYVLEWIKKGTPFYTYEALLQHTPRTLESIAVNLGVAYSPEQLLQAIEKNSKENFKKSLDDTFKHNTFVRKGISGDWRNHFTEQHNVIFQEIAGDALSILGYEVESKGITMLLGANYMPATSVVTSRHSFPETNEGHHQMTQHCWCGNTTLEPFSSHYLRCPVCETLVTAEMPAPEFTAVRDDDQDFYGREYWFSHQEEDLGQANIIERARTDMPERALHWLRTLLKYKLPPGDVLELGSAHGGFVALLRWAGFEASGLELSPSIVEYAKQTFGVPMLLGPVEEQNIAPGSLDAIALMDVLEHLPDPIGTMRHSLSLLKPDGILLIQTPRYAEGKTFAAMEAEHDPFLVQLKHEQHLYLFSHTSARELFQRLRAEHIAFEPAIFGHYDMFIAVSRAPLAETAAQNRQQLLLATANNRMVQALIDLDDARLRVGKQLQEADRDRDARMAVIERQGAELGRIPALEADVEYLKKQLVAAETDRAARLAVIERQGAELGQVQHRLTAAERQLAEMRGLIADIRRLAGTHKREIALRAFSPRTWRRVRGKVKQLLAVHALSQSSTLPASSPADSNQLAEYVAKINQFNAGQPNAPLLNAIRAYNHQMVDTLHGIEPLAGKRLLDIGASPHGYALERALTHKVAEYVGIGLDVEETLTIRAAQGSGTLLYMDATKLDMPDNSFDLVISMSTFEHIGDVATALAEIRRVLKPGGKALLSFEPIWTCSYGHHLHHFGPIARHMPDWAQLVWDKATMLRKLADVWPKDGVPSLEEAAAWVYDSPALNRIGMQQMLQLLRESGLTIEWLTKIPDEPRSAARLKEIEQATGHSSEDLTAKGLSVFLAKH